MKGILFAVNYKNSEDSIKFINSVQSTEESLNIDIIIIDNSGESVENKDISNKLILENYIKAADYKNVFLIVNDKNLGYFGAVSYVIKHRKINLEDYDFAIIANNDIIIRDHKFFVKLQNIIPEAEVISPSIISLITGFDQNPYRVNEISDLHKLYYRVYYMNYLFAVVLLIFSLVTRKARKRRSAGKNLSKYIYSPHGAFVIFTSAFFKKEGYIDDRLFLYGEEEFISAIVSRYNMKIKYTTDLQVFHDEHKTTSKNAFSKKTYQLQKKAYHFIKSNFPGIY
jgi:GT2 family glycosyltransferase